MLGSDNFHFLLELSAGTVSCQTSDYFHDVFLVGTFDLLFESEIFSLEVKMICHENRGISLKVFLVSIRLIFDDKKSFLSSPSLMNLFR